MLLVALILTVRSSIRGGDGESGGGVKQEEEEVVLG